MELVNATDMPAAYTLGLDPDGRERVVVVVKGTFDIPPRGGVAQLAAQQEKFLYADTFAGEPGLSAVEYEYDFAPSKQRCDVLLVGSAHSPDGRPTRRVTVGLRVGPMKKGFEVIGNRYWKIGAMGDLSPSDPEPFVSLPLHYGNAFGGCEFQPGTQHMVSSYAANPVGCGAYPKSKSADIFGKKLPNTQEIGKPITSPSGNYKPMALGPLGRNFAERLRYAGTYDERWFAENFPFLPPDFDTQYFQAAPADQQLPYLRGGEVVQLQNLSPRPIAAFTLPQIALPIERLDAHRSSLVQEANLDALVLEPDRGRLQLIWRTSFPLKRNIHELKQLVIGRMPPGFYRARDLGKSYYPSLGQLAAAKRA